ncbi:cytochrome c biogenesis protein CcsA [soil metagenome]|nr:cytochrome c biogenesis protein CcsA [Trueperaceae bacterium]
MTTNTNVRWDRPVWMKAWAALIVALFAVGAYLGLVWSPPDVNQGNLIRIMYAHVSVAWIGFVAVGLTAFFAALYLWRGKRRDDVLAVASAEMALLFSSLTIIGGMTYSRPTLNTFWTWDAKLTLTALMVALLVGYFIVRALVDDPVRRGRVSAVVAIVVAGSLPFNYLAAEWFRTLHPSRAIALDGSGVTMAPDMLSALLFNTVVAGLVYAWFMVDRVRLGRIEAQLEDARVAQEAVPSGKRGVVRV